MLLKNCRQGLNLLLMILAIIFPITTVNAFEPFQPLPSSPPIPDTNPQTQARIDLGKRLFFDRQLSVNGSLSCNSCHDLSRAGSDIRPRSPGATGKTSERSTPTLWNVAYETVFFWDGRANTLEQAIAEHLLDRNIMAMPTTTTVVETIKTNPIYEQKFNDNFEQGISYDAISAALASFIRSLVTPDSAWDRFLQGDADAISAQAKRGFDTFVETGCASCHFWVNLAGPVPGLAFQQGEGFYELFPNYPGTDYERRYQLSADLGRFYVTRDDTDRRMWRVPVLRNIALTAPYFHNGSVKTLDEAIKVMAKTQLGKDLRGADSADIAAFLATLTSEMPVITLPQLHE